MYNKSISCNTPASVAQWIEHPPPKGRVTRSIRVLEPNSGKALGNNFAGIALFGAVCGIACPAGS